MSHFGINSNRKTKAVALNRPTSLAISLFRAHGDISPYLYIFGILIRIMLMKLILSVILAGLPFDRGKEPLSFFTSNSILAYLL